MKISNRYQKAFEQAKEAPAFWAESAMLDVARQLVARMNETGVKQAKLAQLMGKHAPFVSRVLSGEHNVTIQTIAAVAHALDAHIDVRLVPNKKAAVRADQFSATVDADALSPHNGVSFRNLRLVKMQAVNQTTQERNLEKKAA